MIFLGTVVSSVFLLPLKYFFALIKTTQPLNADMQAAPLWDPKSCQFVGILTVTDFIDVLRYYRETGSDVLTLASRSIADILADEAILSSVLKKNPPRRYASANGEDTGADQHSSFLSVDADANLGRACHLLHEQTLDFLPVMLPSDMRVLATITYTCVLEHLVSNFREQRRLFDDTIYDLGIGTYGEEVVVAYPHQTLHEVLHTLHLHGLSAVPVIDENTKKIRGVYSRSDITFLTKASDAEDAVSNLNLTLDVLMAQQRTDVTTPDALHTCSTRHTLQYVFEYFAQWKFNRLICVDEEERVVGVVSARDLVAYFLASWGE